MIRVSFPNTRILSKCIFFETLVLILEIYILFKSEKSNSKSKLNKLFDSIIKNFSL